MKTTIAITILLLVTTVTADAQLSSNTMMKIATRDTSPDIASGSFRAKPKVLYRMGTIYGRSEEQPDPDQGIHGLMVIAEPKAWIINLSNKTGRLVIDPGPTYVFRACIIPPEGRNKIPPLRDFEFCREYEFLRLHKAKSLQESIQNKTYDVLVVTIKGYRLKLFSTKGKEQPFRVSVSKGDKLVCQYDYDEYKSNLAPQMDLFKPPGNVKIIETAKPSHNKDNMKLRKDLGQSMMTFHQTATIENFAIYQKTIDKMEGSVSTRENRSDLMIAVSIARISEKHNWSIDGKGYSAQQAKEILKGKSDLARYINDDTTVDPSKLDIWWISFFATGDTNYLKKILKYAGEPMPKDNMEKLLVIGAATWSFKSNCKQDKTVAAFAKSQLKENMTPEKKKFLKECVEYK